MSEDGMYIISGSENGKVYIWNRRSDFIPIVNPSLFSRFDPNHNRSYETFTPFIKEKALFTFFVPFSIISRVNSYMLENYEQPLRIKCGMVIVGQQGGIAALYSEQCK
jgi:hypothetical protein